MKRPKFMHACRISVLVLATVVSGCSTMASMSQLGFKDPRCTRGQWCAYTDRPAEIRTEVLRPNLPGTWGYDPAVR